MRIALLGGSFNPPHLGHVLNACHVLAAHRVDRIWLMPVYRHAFDKALAPFDVRCELCERAIAPFAARMAVTRVEQEVAPGSRTVDVLDHLLPRHPDDEFSLVLGSDLLGEVHLWKAFDRIEQMVRIIVVPRAGYPDPRAQGPVLPEVSSTLIRQMLARGEDPGALLPNGVRDYLREHPIYR
ncbi:MAG: nicotinate (nicotinamide) nucleotide adenylyltransferase [Myxococcales bacterium]|jgi:nicotinate-nucleotide adenylyltransferase|nr:nicotinate (nicotinamide) nucleotide adenylyltransferase [Myxococcales bacterium]